MKRLFILIVAAMMTVSMMAEGHMKFKGVEIDGTRTQFVSQLSKKGCEVGVNYIGVEMIQADFAGLNMLVCPLTTSQTQAVYAVIASTRYIDDKASSLAQYNSLKKLMTEKYGEGQYVSMEDGYYANSIGVFERGNASNAIFFVTSNGSIILYQHKETLGTNVVVEYIDNTNDSLRKEEASDDI